MTEKRGLDAKAEQLNDRDHLCSNCIHRQNSPIPWTCRAFPDEGIPDDIVSGQFQHTTWHPQQDNDIVYRENRFVSYDCFGFIPVNQCGDCKHLDLHWPWKCAAYPEQVPPDIFSDQVAHDTVRADQQGEWVFKLKGTR